MSYKDKNKQKEYYHTHYDKLKEKKRHHNYYIKNKIEYLQRGKECYVKNKEKINERHKQWRLLNKNYHIDYYNKNKEKFLLRGKQYYINNKNKYLELAKKYIKDNREKKLLYTYRLLDKKHNFVCNLTETWIKENITSHSCTYCGDTKRIGCDRIDNTKGHTINNVVPACYNCNLVRNNIFSFEEMLILGSTIKQIKQDRKLKNTILKLVA
jgi:hypothetical protein